MSNSLARNSAIVFAGSMTSNVLAYVYHLCIGRLLGPSGYGEFSSLLSLFYIFSVPLLVAQTVLVKFISGLKAQNALGETKYLFWRITKLFAIISFIGLPIVFVSAPWIQSFLHLSSSGLFMLLYLALVISLLVIVPSSILQGYQRFLWVSVFTVGTVAARILFGVPMTVWGVYGVTLAAVFAGVIIYVLYFYPLRFILTVESKTTAIRKREAFTYAIPTLLTLLGITSLYSTDIILVRHFLSATEAGSYAALAILGKVIYYASSAVALVLFPVLSERTAIGATTKKITVASIAGVGAISIGITILYFLFPDFIVGLLFGKAYVSAGTFLGLFGIFLSLFSIGNIMAMACLALGHTGVWFIPLVCAILQIVGITFWHSNIGAVISLNISICAVFVLGTVAYYLKVTYEKI